MSSYVDLSVTESGVQVVTDNVGSMFLDRRSYEPGCPLWDFLEATAIKTIGDFLQSSKLKGKILVRVDTYGFQMQWSYR